MEKENVIFQAAAILAFAERVEQTGLTKSDGSALTLGDIYGGPYRPVALGEEVDVADIVFLTVPSEENTASLIATIPVRKYGNVF